MAEFIKSDDESGGFKGFILKSHNKLLIIWGINMKATVINSAHTKQDIDFYETINVGYTLTERSIRLEGKDRYGLPWEETLPIFKGKAGHNWTPYGMARQTKNHIICARYDRFYKFTLDGEIVSLDAEDNDSER